MFYFNFKLQVNCLAVPEQSVTEQHSGLWAFVAPGHFIQFQLCFFAHTNHIIISDIQIQQQSEPKTKSFDFKLDHATTKHTWIFQWHTISENISNAAIRRQTDAFTFDHRSNCIRQLLLKFWLPRVLILFCRVFCSVRNPIIYDFHAVLQNLKVNKKKYNEFIQIE